MDLSVKACRICLTTDVKIFFIDNSIEHDIKLLFGNNESTGIFFPHYICYECVFLLMKFIKFRKKYMLAQSILYDMLKTYNKITEQDIKQISKLKSDLHYRTLPPISLTEEIHVTLEMIVDEETSPLEFKPEVETKPDVMEFKVDVIERTYDDQVGFNDRTSVDQWNDDVPLVNYILDSKNSNNIKKAGKRKCNRTKKMQTKNSETDSNEKEKEQIEDEFLKDYTVIHLSMSEQLAELEKRKESSNYKDAPFKCDLCYKGFLVEDTFKNHAIKHDASLGEMVCEVCKFRFPKRYILNHHAAKHAKKYACNKCDFVAMFRDQIKKHLQWHDGVLYKCQYCDEVSTKKTSHLSHLRMKHPSQFVCDVCGYSYISALGLKQHKSKMHKGRPETEDAKEVKSDKKDPNRYCEECDVLFMSEQARKRHMVTSAKHTEKLGTSCRDCGASFPSAASLRAHWRAHAAARTAASLQVARARLRRRGGYPRRCEHCPETLTSRMRHWKHYQRCHKDKKYPLGEKLFICEYCGKKFQSNNHVLHHVRVSCAARPVSAPLACAHCAAAAPTKLDLQQHILKCHPEVRSFPCKECGKMFWRANYLSQHETRCRAARKKAAT